MRHRTSIGINISRAFFYIIFCLTALYATMEFSSLTLPVISGYKLPLLRILLGLDVFILIPILQTILGRKYDRAVASFVMLIIAALLSSMMTQNLSFMKSTSKLGTELLILYLVQLFVLYLYASQYNIFSELVAIVNVLLLALAVANDIIYFGDLFNSNKSELYFLGSKFSVVYIHMCSVAFMVMRDLLKNKKETLKYVLWALYSVFVSMKVDCNTGIVSILLLLLLLLYLPDRVVIKMAKKETILITLTFSVLIVFALTGILASPLVSGVLQNVFDTDITLTGRTDIYSRYWQNMLPYSAFGVGYTNAYRASMTFFRYADAQNGILQWIMNLGLIGTLVMVTIVTNVFSDISTQKSNNIRPLIILIYVYIFIAIVEIPFNNAFFLWIIILGIWANNEKKIFDFRKGKQS